MEEMCGPHNGPVSDHSVHELEPRRKAITQSCHVAGICSGRGGMNIQRDQLRFRRQSSAAPHPTLPSLLPPRSRYPVNIPHTNALSSSSRGGVAPMFHRCAAIGPVKASTKPLGPVIRKAENSSCASSRTQRQGHALHRDPAGAQTHMGRLDDLPDDTPGKRLFSFFVKDFMGLSWVHQLHERSQRLLPTLPPSLTHLPHSCTHTHRLGLTLISRLFGSLMSAMLLARISCAQLPPTVTQTAHSGARAHAYWREGRFYRKKKKLSRADWTEWADRYEGRAHRTSWRGATAPQKQHL